MKQENLIAITGTMFGGKTSRLIDLGQNAHIRGLGVVFVKPALDNRYADDKIVTHDGVFVKAFVVKHPEYGLPLTSEIYGTSIDVVCIDEVQFFGVKLIEDIQTLIKLGKQVIVSGLEKDFAGRGFGIMPKLIYMADSVERHNAPCKNCKNTAEYSHRHVGDNEQVAVGGSDKYIPLCTDCYIEALNSRIEYLSEYNDDLIAYNNELVIQNGELKTILDERDEMGVDEC
jgi:thymidine kinase